MELRYRYVLVYRKFYGICDLVEFCSMCIRLSGIKYWYCVNDKYDYVCYLKVKDMIIMVRLGLIVW